MAKHPVTNPNDKTQSSVFIDEVTGWQVIKGGLTKREYFAGLALQSMIIVNEQDNTGCIEMPTTARDAVAFADALIGALNAE